jgi:nucleotide-binding universal stress UspA family protein
MFKHLIVPLDGSRLSESVLPMVADLAQKLQATVTLVHVIEKNAPVEIHGEPHLFRVQEAEHYLDEVERRYFSPGLQVDKHVHKTAITNVAHSIVEHAKELDSDLVVMSAHGRGGIRKLLFGSIAQQVVSAKLTPVLLLQPAQGKSIPILSHHPFLVPLDGSTIREKALPIAASLASAYGVDLKLLMVVPTLETLSGFETTFRTLLPTTTQELLKFALKDAEEYVGNLLSGLKASDSKATVEIKGGDLAEVIVAEAHRLKVGLIVMGTQGQVGLNAFWSSSLAPKIANLTQLAILLVPAGRASRDR